MTVGGTGDKTMGTSLNATFETRREAEMTVERLAQEQRLDRADICIAAAGDENTAGIEQALSRISRRRRSATQA